MTSHKHKRRTLDEAQELALEQFRASVEEHLSDQEIEELRQFGTIGGGSPGSDWADTLGEEPTDRDYYEFGIYRPSDECPYVEKYFARILVPRNRQFQAARIVWKPTVPEYNGPWFS